MSGVPDRESSSTPLPLPLDPGTEGKVWDDPTSLLRVYPFATYTPTARVAEHFSTHAVTYPTPTSVSDIYPQHAEQFKRMDHPQTAEDWALRDASEARARELLAAYPRQDANTAYPSPFDFSTFMPSSRPRDPSLPLPYNFLPSYTNSPSANAVMREPPTPSSIASPSPSPSISTADYFENFVTSTLERAERAKAVLPGPRASTPHIPSRQSSVAETPTIARTLAQTSINPHDSPDPLALPSPSPTKKHRPDGPPLTPSTLGGGGKPIIDLSPSQTYNIPSRPPTVLFPLQRASSSSMQGPRQTTQHVASVAASKKLVDPSSDDEDESSDDALDWGEDRTATDKDGDWTMDDAGYRSPSPTAAIMRGSRTGERDSRTSFQKLTVQFEDIFEESDSFPPNPAPEDLASSKYFSTLSRDSGNPLLSPRAIDKTIRYISRIKGKKKVEGSVWDTDTLSRFLRMLERCMRDGDGVEIFKEDRTVKNVIAKVKKVGKRGPKKVSSKSPDHAEAKEESSDPGLSDEDKDKSEANMARLHLAGMAATCTLVLLNSDGLSKQLYSEDLLSLVVTILKDILTRVIFPVVEGLAGEKVFSAYLASVLAGETSTARQGKFRTLTALFNHPTLSAICATASTALPQLVSLLAKPEMAFSDSLIIQTVYLAITPFFVSEPTANTRGKKAKDGPTNSPAGSLMKTLRIEALSLLRVTFAKYEDQRQWIIEEILTSLVKLPDQSSAKTRFQLTNGASIHIISALLLQLLQATAYGAVARVRKVQHSALEVEIIGGDAQKVDITVEESWICSETMEAVLKSTKLVAGYLVQRSGASKSNKTSHDTDYKAVLETLVADLLVVLYRPEWPTASLFLAVLSKVLMSALEEQKPGADVSSARSIALDHLGGIAARLRSLDLQMKRDPIPTLDEVISSADVNGVIALISAQKSIQTYLAHAAREDDMFACASDMGSVVWGQEVQSAIKKAASVVDKLAVEKDEEAERTREQLQSIVQHLRTASRNIWLGDQGLFEIGDPKEADSALSASIAVSRGRSLQSAFDPILHALSSSMDSPVVALRSKALRGLGSIVTVDPDILGLPFIRQAFEDRLADSSPAVRDAAVELVGKYVVQKPHLATDYYPYIAMRVDDSGLGVRKRVIKLLRGIFACSTDQTIKVDICCKMILMMSDHDDTVQELATKTLGDILFPADTSSDTATLLVEVLGEFAGSNKILEKAIQGLLPEIPGGIERFKATIDTLISRLIDATEQNDFDSLSHVRAINLLCASDPSLIDTNKASVLLTYLRPPANVDEQAKNDTLLRIFQRCIPKMPRAASTFANDLIKTLTPMISKPTGGFYNIKEAVGCWCTAISHLTRDYTDLFRILKACELRLQHLRQQYSKATPEVGSTAAAALLLYITALIVENCDLDSIAEQDKVVAQQIESMTQGAQVVEHFYLLFLDFTRYPIIHSAPSIAIGCLFSGYPSLLLREDAVAWMDGVFRSRDIDNQAKLFVVMYEYLAREADRKVSGKVKRDIKALIGNNTDMSESGLSTAVVQRNITHILNGAKSSYPQIQDAALDVLAFTVNQGLYHPLQCLPILISLETSDDPVVADRALALHSTLHSKHATLVNVRFLDFTKASYEYQRSLSSEVSGHRHGQALLSGWYSLISDKKAWRLDFIKALSRAFDYDLSRSEVPNVGFVLYVSENLATLEYKTQDEVMSAVQYLSGVISGSAHLAGLLERIQVDGQSEDPIAGRVAEGSEAINLEAAGNIMILVCLALLTKNHLLDMYSLSEDKCLKHVPGKKSVQGDKAATRKAQWPLNTGAIWHPRGVTTVGEYKDQVDTFLRLLQEDGTLGGVDL